MMCMKKYQLLIHAGSMDFIPNQLPVQSITFKNFVLSKKKVEKKDSDYVMI